ncbi:S1C family serine protease [Nocardioides sp.]|uniref:S1C family serine protease n=1 Tax=Nocardioides sp. TaxID=35761 RepID=UPI002D80B1B5|nr:trypsin-like peptidase domain-containing protein [Nocardioides sp.]HET8962210.1 trypsin-like peptidase domain-containing protein [Nocardioides sp.]
MTDYETRPIMPPPAPYGEQPPPRRGRGPITASVLVGALVLGGGAGVAGAAAWQEWGGDGSATNGGTGSSASIPVADTGDSPAPAGSVEQVAAEVLPSVVKINVVGEEQGQPASGSGSGIILSEDGTILTNNHVVELAEGGGEISVSFENGDEAAAEILGADPLTDTAVIRAEDVSGLTEATIGKSGNLDIGQSVVAVGAPFGLDSTVTSGIVSALDRPVSVGTDAEGQSTTYPAIQTDAAINPGNSGGPLVDMSGAVVGINSSIRTTGESTGQGGSIGLGFAIPMDEVMPVVEQMLAGDTPTHARLGISVSDVEQQAGELPSEGAQVQEVTPGSTADDAGLERGDVITRIDDTLITGADSLVATIRSYRPGDEVTLTYRRGGDEERTTLVLDSDAS